MRKNLKISDTRGFVVAYILAAIAMLSTLVVVTAKIRQTDSTVQQVATVSDTLTQQANLIRAKLNECRARFPNGDNGLGFRLSFPAAPVSGLVSDLVCPGSAKSLWTSSDGAYAPTAPVGFSPWRYVHDATSVRVYLDQAGAGSGYAGGAKSASLRLGEQANWTSPRLLVTIAN